MPIRIACPECRTPYALPETMNGKKVRCMKCSHVMVVAAPEPEAEVLELEAVEPPTVSRPSKAKKAPLRDEEVPEVEAIPESRPRKAAAASVKSASDDDGLEEEDRPRRKAKRKRARQASGSDTDLYRVALYQKAILLCVLANLTVIGLRFGLSPAWANTVSLVTIPISIASSVFLFLLAIELFGIVVAAVLALIGLLPVLYPLVSLASFLILLIVNGAATRRLKAGDVSVGLLGASISEARRAGGSSPAKRGLSYEAIGGIAAIVLVGAVGSWFGGLADVFDGSWPELGSRISVNDPVTLHISGVKDKQAYDEIYGKASALVDPKTAGRSSVATRDNDRMTVVIAPVADPNEFAAKINFGKVRRISGRIIRVDAFTTEAAVSSGSAANGAAADKDNDEVAKALRALQTGSQGQLEGLLALKNLKPDDRRAEVLKAIDPLLKGRNLGNFHMALDIFDVWGTKEDLPQLLEAFGNPKLLDHSRLFESLARFKDPRAIDTLAKRMENLYDREKAAEALKSYGAQAEKPVAERLDNSEFRVRQLACEVLKVIGTKQSIPALEALAKKSGRDRVTQKSANDAIKAINDRS
jgi:predicted Zn finger-like uncharacterized protein